MQVVFIDTNVLLDFFLNREGTELANRRMRDCDQ